MVSSSATHCLRFALRKRYAWRRRKSYTSKYAFLQDCHVLSSNRIWKSSRETWCNNVDLNLPNTLLSAIEQQETDRKDKVKRSIQQFKSHPNKESFFQDLNQTEKINKFSEKSQELIADMNNTEIFELCETSSKKQCPDCTWRCF